MQPNTLNKPVMDVAAPPKTPMFGASSAPTAPINLAVQAAPAAAAALQPTSPISLAPTTPTAPADSPKARLPKVESVSTKPVALITVTVFIMLVLSALAVTIYVTTRTA